MTSKLTDVARAGLAGPVRRVVTRENSALGLHLKDAISYNGAGFRTETIDYVLGELDGTETYDYDTNGRPTRAHRTSKSAKVHEAVFEYNSNGQLTRTMTYEGQTLLQVRIDTYDSNGRLLQTDLGEWGVETFTYDNAGLPLEVVHYLPHGNRMTQTYSDYIFDSFGNWVQRTISLSIFINGKPTRDVPTWSTEFRSITNGN